MMKIDTSISHNLGFALISVLCSASSAYAQVSEYLPPPTGPYQSSVIINEIEDNADHSKQVYKFPPSDLATPDSQYFSGGEKFSQPMMPAPASLYPAPDPRGVTAYAPSPVQMAAPAMPVPIQAMPNPAMAAPGEFSYPDPSTIEPNFAAPPPAFDAGDLNVSAEQGAAPSMPVPAPDQNSSATAPMNPWAEGAQSAPPEAQPSGGVWGNAYSYPQYPYGYYNNGYMPNPYQVAPSPWATQPQQVYPGR